MVQTKSTAWQPELWTELKPHWVQLLDRTQSPSAFLSEAWIGNWLETFGAQLRPTALTFSTENRGVVGCALVPSRRCRVGPLSISQLLLNASGTSEVGCEHNDILTDPEMQDDVDAALFHYLMQQGSDQLVLEGVRPRLLKAFKGLAVGAGWDGFESESPFVALDSVREADDYLSLLSSNTRSQIRRSVRLYEEEHGPPSVDASGSVGEALEWLSELIVLHEARWAAVGEQGAFAGSARVFHEKLLDRTHDESDPSRLRTDVVRVRFGDTTIGVLYMLVSRGCVQFYQSGFQYASDRRLKPGLVAHKFAVEMYADSDASEYDFLGGEPAAVRYKRSLSTDSRMLHWGEFASDTWRMRAIGVGRSVKQRLEAFRSDSDE